MMTLPKRHDGTQTWQTLERMHVETQRLLVKKSNLVATLYRLQRKGEGET